MVAHAGCHDASCVPIFVQLHVVAHFLWNTPTKGSVIIFQTSCRVYLSIEELISEKTCFPHSSTSSTGIIIWLYVTTCLRECGYISFIGASLVMEEADLSQPLSPLGVKRSGFPYGLCFDRGKM